jgi:P4 family phage/plasmid primase-like protien
MQKTTVPDHHTPKPPSKQIPVALVAGWLDVGLGRSHPCPLCQHKPGSVADPLPQVASTYCFRCNQSINGIRLWGHVKGVAPASAKAQLLAEAKRNGHEAADIQGEEADPEQTRVTGYLRYEYVKSFGAQIFEDVGCKALDYARSRGLAEATIRDERVGYDLDFGDSGFKQAELPPEWWNDWSDSNDGEQRRRYREVVNHVGSGMVAYRRTEERRHAYSRFHGRLVLALWLAEHEVGDIVGRALPGGEEAGPKYLRAPDPEAEGKRHPAPVKMWDVAAPLPVWMDHRDHRPDRDLLIVEGELDFYLGRQAGGRMLCTRGKAVTEDAWSDVLHHCRKTLDAGHRVVIAYDGDEAGRTAARKLVVDLGVRGVRAHALALGADEDLADVLRDAGFRHRDPETDWVSVEVQVERLRDLLADAVQPGWRVLLAELSMKTPPEELRDGLCRVGLWDVLVRDHDLFPVVREALADERDVPNPVLTNLGRQLAQMRKRLSANERLAQATVLDLTDKGNAARMKAMFEVGLAWCKQRTTWLHYRAGVWHDDHEERPQAAAKEVIEKMTEEAATLGIGAREALESWAHKTKAEPRVTAMIKMAKDELAVRLDQFDADPWLLNTKSGLLRLETGELVPHDPRRYCTRMAGPIAIGEPISRFESFLQMTFAGDEDLIRYVRQLAGLSLVGEVVEHLFIICLGAGENGKSVFMDVLLAVLGSYGVKVAKETLTMVKGQRHEEEIAWLRGRRLAVTEEIQKTDAMNEARVKALTSSGKLTAREMHGRRFEFVPSHTLWMAVNHPPRTTGTDHGLWRRLKVIPFIVKVPAEKKVPNYDRILVAEEGPGILAWAYEGLRDYLENGLVEPRAVTDATNAYRASQDTTGQFLDECYVRDPGGRVQVGVLYAEYVRWAEGQGIRRPLRRSALLEELQQRGHAKVVSGGRTYVRGFTDKDETHPHLTALAGAEEEVDICDLLDGIDV